MMRSLIIFFLLLQISFANAADKLDSRITYRLDKAFKSLEYADSNISKNYLKDAEISIKSAEGELKQVFEYYSGKFDPEHPTIVKLQNQIAALKSKLKMPVTAVATSKKTTDSASAESTVSNQKLSGPLAYKMKQFWKSVEGIQNQIKYFKFKNASHSITQLKGNIKQQLEWNKEKVTAKHPEFVAISAEVDRLEAIIEENLAESEKLKKQLLPVITAINEINTNMQTALTEARYSMLAISSLESHYSQYRKQQKITDTIENIHLKVGRINALLPVAVNLADNFKKQFPDEQKLQDLLGNKGWDASVAADALVTAIKTWDEVSNKQMQQLVSDATVSIQAAMTKIDATNPADKTKTSVAISNAEFWAVNYYGPLLAAVDATYPTGNTKDSAVPLSEKQKQLLKKAHDLQSKVIILENKIAKLTNASQAATTKRIAAARFPSKNTTRIGADEAEVSKVIDAQFSSKPLRMAVYAPWETRTEARWVNNNHWDVGTFKYLGVWIAKKTVSGKYRVYRMMVRNRKQANGSWGSLKYWSVGNSYQILKKNISL